jgi:hypothetical protein
MYTQLNTKTPYFYIIRHIITSKMYAGCRYAKKCHPSELLQPDGYHTSSKIINNIIKSEGLVAFEILRIDTNLDGFAAYEYESAFLDIMKCATSDTWYNKTNNSSTFVQDKNTILTCQYCNISMNTPSNFIKYHGDNCKHNPNHKSTIYTCDYCDYTSTDKSVITKYHNVKCKKHPNYVQPQIECEHCGVICGNTASYKTHHGDNCPKKPNYVPAFIKSCEHCGKVCTLPSQYTRNHGHKCPKNPNYDPVLYHCDFCNNDVTDLTEYKRYHGDNCNSNPNKVKQVFYKTCEFCGHNCSSKLLYTRDHGAKCLKNPDYTPPIYHCDCCGQDVLTLTALKRFHGVKCKKHPNYVAVKDVTCEHCGVESNKLLYSLYHGEKCKSNPNYVTTTIKCEWCGYDCPTQSEYTKRHGNNCKKHPEYKPTIYKICEECGTSCENKSQYKNHGKNCTQNITSTYCEYCNRTITHKMNFKEYHGENCNQHPKNLVIYECGVCGTILSTQGSYNRHKKTCKFKYVILKIISICDKDTMNPLLDYPITNNKVTVNKSKKPIKYDTTEKRGSMYGRLGVDNPNYGKTLSVEHKKKISDGCKNKNIGAANKSAIEYHLTDPTGNLHIIKGGFEKFCKEHNISEKVLRRHMNKGIIPTIESSSSTEKSRNTYGWSGTNIGKVNVKS